MNNINLLQWTSAYFQLSCSDDGNGIKKWTKCSEMEFGNDSIPWNAHKTTKPNKSHFLPSFLPLSSTRETNQGDDGGVVTLRAENLNLMHQNSSAYQWFPFQHLEWLKCSTRKNSILKWANLSWKQNELWANKFVLISFSSHQQITRCKFHCDPPRFLASLGFFLTLHAAACFNFANTRIRKRKRQFRAAAAAVAFIWTFWEW